MNYVHIFCVCALTILMFGARKSAALYCSQCNIRFLGVQSQCVEPRNASGCIGCMKTIAKVKLRDSGYIDGWERKSVVVSRLCISPGNINVKPEGCYKQQNNGGYTERCYCYTDNCNSGASRQTTDFISSLLSLPLFFHTSNIAVLVLLLLVFPGVQLWF